MYSRQKKKGWNPLPTLTSLPNTLLPHPPPSSPPQILSSTLALPLPPPHYSQLALCAPLWAKKLKNTILPHYPNPLKDIKCSHSIYLHPPYYPPPPSLPPRHTLFLFECSRSIYLHPPYYPPPPHPPRHTSCSIFPHLTCVRPLCESFT